jgi:hypothetical protein
VFQLKNDFRFKEKELEELNFKFTTMEKENRNLVDRSKNMNE